MHCRAKLPHHSNEQISSVRECEWKKYSQASCEELSGSSAPISPSVSLKRTRIPANGRSSLENTSPARDSTSHFNNQNNYPIERIFTRINIIIIFVPNCEFEKEAKSNSVCLVCVFECAARRTKKLLTRHTVCECVVETASSQPFDDTRRTQSTVEVGEKAASEQKRQHPAA